MHIFSLLHTRSGLSLRKQGDEIGALVVVDEMHFFGRLSLPGNTMIILSYPDCYEETYIHFLAMRSYHACSSAMCLICNSSLRQDFDGGANSTRQLIRTRRFPEFGMAAQALQSPVHLIQSLSRGVLR